METLADSDAAVLAGVFSPPFLHKLDRLHLSVRRSLSTRPGNTPMPRGAQGSGIEVESYKPYDPGDDLRHLDWNAYGRLDQLLIKTFRAEREAPLHIFVDVSASMAAPAGDAKVGFAFGLAASLAYISLCNNDPVRVVGLGAALPQLHLASPFFRHRQQLHRVRAALLALRARGATALASGIAAALRAQRAPGVAVVRQVAAAPDGDPGVGGQSLQHCSMHQPDRRQVVEQAVLEAGGRVGDRQHDAAAAAEGLQALVVRGERRLIPVEVRRAERDEALPAALRIDELRPPEQLRRVALTGPNEPHGGDGEAARDQIPERRLVLLGTDEKIGEHDGNARCALRA